MSDRGLRPAQSRALRALLEGVSLEEAAILAHVSQRTLRRWRSDPAFAATLLESQRGVLDAAAGDLQGACQSAVRALRHVVERGGESVPISAVISAARVILELAARFREGADLDKRISALEGALAGSLGLR